METKKDNLKKVKDNQADEPPLSETESKNSPLLRQSALISVVKVAGGTVISYFDDINC